ncbi:MAG TPA: FAD-dependent oxidoreductase [Amycolatopsis sp.]|nr:FAD-dependent oxidoreductase [Amycolatopsis sp.]
MKHTVDSTQDGVTDGVTDGATDVAIVGAGPYGLSIAAHLRPAGLRVRQFGLPMSLWRTAMPEGMFLKSQGFASNLSDPRGSHTLAAFCAATGRPYADYGKPVPLEVFIAYGEWFRRELVPDVEEVLVDEVTDAGSHYQLTLADGGHAKARAVVVATGVEHFRRVPPELEHLSSEVCSHSADHTDLAVFAGRRVVVLGAGQSALETAALLAENGADARIVARTDELVWNGRPLPPDRPLRQRLREPEAGLGSGWGTWFYSDHPSWFRRLPRGTRVYRARTGLGPAGASWLRARVEDRIPVLLGRRLRAVSESGGEVVIDLEDRAGERTEIRADHLIAATGYRPALDRLRFLSAPLRSRLRTVDGTPEVGRDYQSSVPGLYFAGPAVAPTFGPVMRFVYGADHAAKAVAGALAPLSARRGAVLAGARG